MVSTYIFVEKASGMSHNLLDTEETRVEKAPIKEELVSPDAPLERPIHVPDKFWDSETRQLRTEELVKSYLALEKKLGSRSVENVPPTPNDYEIDLKNELLSNDPEVNHRLHAAGFSNTQAQLVYDLAAEKLAPLVTEVASFFEAENQVGRLIQRFGGETRWRETSRQIAAWGKSHLPQQVFDALATTYEGVVTMYGMMENNEPGLLREGEMWNGAPTEAQLKQMMRDPRYWRDQEPEFVDKVRDGFQKLYPGRG
jgi:hypothetical protein